VPKVYSYGFVAVLVAIICGAVSCLFFQLLFGEWSLGLAPTGMVVVLLCILVSIEKRVVVVFRPWSLEKATSLSVPVVHNRWSYKFFSRSQLPYRLDRAQPLDLTVPMEGNIWGTLIFFADTPQGVDSLYRLRHRGVKAWVDLWSRPQPTDPRENQEWVSDFLKRLESSLDEGGYPGIQVSSSTR
jgi:hypothetical protein